MSLKGNASGHINMRCETKQPTKWVSSWRWPSLIETEDPRLINCCYDYVVTVSSVLLISWYCHHAFTSGWVNHQLIWRHKLVTAPSGNFCFITSNDVLRLRLITTYMQMRNTQRWVQKQCWKKISWEKTGYVSSISMNNSGEKKKTCWKHGRLMRDTV